MKETIVLVSWLPLIRESSGRGVRSSKVAVLDPDVEILALPTSAFPVGLKLDLSSSLMNARIIFHDHYNSVP